jgi:hypothetical protein
MLSDLLMLAEIAEKGLLNFPAKSDDFCPHDFALLGLVGWLLPSTVIFLKILHGIENCADIRPTNAARFIQ